MIIRTVNTSDIPAILNIWNPLIRDTLVTFTTAQKSKLDLRQMILKKAADNLPFLVSAQGNTVIGFATYAPFRTGPGYAFTMEHSIMLAASAQGQGGGRQLLTALEDHAKINHIHSLIAGVSAANPSAIAFHHACDFLQVGLIPQAGYKFDKWLDLILLQKHL